MKTLNVTIGGRELPCRLTMGALILFKRNMGKDVSQMDTSDLEELLMLMWCCVVCAGKADGVDFDMDFETFTCNVTPAELAAWNEAAASEEQKKTES